jgi:hypothetical protein
VDHTAIRKRCSRSSIRNAVDSRQQSAEASFRMESRSSYYRPVKVIVFNGKRRGGSVRGPRAAVKIAASGSDLPFVVHTAGCTLRAKNCLLSCVLKSDEYIISEAPRGCSLNRRAPLSSVSRTARAPLRFLLCPCWTSSLLLRCRLRACTEC